MRAASLALVLLLPACGPGNDAEVPPAPGGASTWSSLSPMPTPRTEVAAAAADGRILVAGGFFEDGTTVGTVEIYDIAADRWSAGPDLPIAVNHAMAAASGDDLYVLGGFTAEGPPTSRAFALRDGRWEELPEMPEARGAGGAAVLDGLVYVVAGVGPEGHATRTLVFDPTAERWTSVAGVSVPRDHLGVASAGGRIYAVGGRTEALVGNLGDSEAYDPTSDAWTALPDLPTPRGGVAAAATADGIVVTLGGEEEGGTFDEAEAYDPGGDRWFTLPPMPTARHGLGAVAVGSTIYAVGGGTEPGLSESGALEAIEVSA
ncbi:MAG: galactose oxidase [Actinomycetota bacterium]|nr:galactose oxidase [Actinomycetota bacterium]